MFTVLWIAGTRPDHLSALRSPDHATSKIFSKLCPFFVHPLMIWMRSRLPEVGSFTAQTTNVGALPFIGARSAPMGTPFAYDGCTQSFAFRMSWLKPHPPKK